MDRRQKPQWTGVFLFERPRTEVAIHERLQNSGLDARVWRYGVDEGLDGFRPRQVSLVPGAEPPPRSGVVTLCGHSQTIQSLQSHG